MSLAGSRMTQKKHRLTSRSAARHHLRSNPLLYRGLVAVQSRFSRGFFQTTPIASALGSMCSTFCQSPPFFGLEDTTQHEVCFSAVGTSVFARVRPS